MIRVGGLWSVGPHWLPLLRNLIFVTDALFALPRLTEIYDLVEEERNDLDHYLAIAAEFGARSVLDVGCGTGTFACLLAGRGIEVAGVDPAAASLAVARAKPGAQRVRWLHGDATNLPELHVDLATMTANVAHVFLTDEEWSATLRDIMGRSAPAAIWSSRPGTRARGRGCAGTAMPPTRGWTSPAAAVSRPGGT